jgi:penicillin-binding protein 1A
MAKRAKKKTKPAKRGLVARSLLWLTRTFWRVIWYTGTRAAAVLALVLGGGVIYYYVTLPDVSELSDGRERGSVILTDRAGEVFAWRGEQYGGQLRAGAASPHLVNAVVATEDKRFFSHFGLDPRGIARATLTNYRAGRVVQGGSTITQQVAKLLFFDNTRSLERHIKQIPIVLAMELKYDKSDILSIYLNRVYLGAGANGFEAASQRYFGKSAREVSAPEAAMLAGLLKAPSRYAPTKDISVAQGRANVIVNLMEEQGFLTGAEARIAREHPAQLSQAAEARAGGYFADWVMEDAPDFLSSATTEDVEIRTTFDPLIQRQAEAALARVFDTKVKPGSKAQAAIVVMSPDGAVRAIVGGRSIDGESPGQFNRATQALRQTGSSFKPFVYAAALELGFTPNDLVEDAPITLNVPGSGDWSPKNYTGEYFGPVTLSFALANSLNTAAVRVSQHVGDTLVRALAQDFGIKSPLAPGPAFVLGTSEATLLEMTGAYAGLLNGGRLAEPYGLTELTVRGDDTPLFEGDRSFGHRVINERAAGHLIYMMNQTVEAGSGQRARLADRPAAGKTGTTQGARDAWFIGFTAHYVTGVWMGYDDNSKLTGVTGSGLPAEIWHETMTRIHDGLLPRPLPMIIPQEQVAQAPGGDVGDVAEEAAKSVLQKVLEDLFSSN